MGDPPPGHDEGLLIGARPLDDGQRNLARDQRLGNLGVGEGRGKAFGLEPVVTRVDGTGNVDGKAQCRLAAEDGPGGQAGEEGQAEHGAG